MSKRGMSGMNETPPQGAQRPAASPNKQTQSFFARSSAMKRLNLLICSACSIKKKINLFSFLCCGPIQHSTQLHPQINSQSIQRKDNFLSFSLLIDEIDCGVGWLIAAVFVRQALQSLINSQFLFPF